MFYKIKFVYLLILFNSKLKKGDKMLFKLLPILDILPVMPGDYAANKRTVKVEWLAHYPLQIGADKDFVKFCVIPGLQSGALDIYIRKGNKWLDWQEKPVHKKIAEALDRIVREAFPELFEKKK